MLIIENDDCCSAAVDCFCTEKILEMSYSTVIEAVCLSESDEVVLLKLSKEESLESVVMIFANCTEDVNLEFSTKSSIESDRTD
jgi:hypothetical protein